VRQYLLRVNADGSWDSTFDAGGFVYAGSGYGLDNVVARDRDRRGRRILVGGDFASRRAYFARLTATGARTRPSTRHGPTARSRTSRCNRRGTW